MDNAVFLQNRFLAKGGKKGGESDGCLDEEFKSLVAEVLTPHASAIPARSRMGVGCPRQRLAPRNAGLLLAFEKTGYVTRQRALAVAPCGATARLCGPAAHVSWAMRSLVRTCRPNFAYTAPCDPKDVNEQEATRMGRKRSCGHTPAECQRHAILSLEFVG